MWVVHHGVIVSMTTVSISSDPFIPHAGDWRRLKELLEGDVERVGIGPWTAKSAAEVLLTQRWEGSVE